MYMTSLYCFAYHKPIFLITLVFHVRSFNCSDIYDLITNFKQIKTGYASGKLLYNHVYYKYIWPQKPADVFKLYDGLMGLKAEEKYYPLAYNLPSNYSDCELSRLHAISSH